MIKAGEIYFVNLDPSVGIETQKFRPCLVLNKQVFYGKLHIVAPMLIWKSMHHHSPFFLKIDPSAINGLDKPRTPDLFQMRSVDTSIRFGTRLGQLDPNQLSSILAATKLIFT
jgi:mRNA interferase MazF